MLSLKKPLSAKQWQAYSDEWEQSNLPQKAFCKQKGLSYQAFSKARSDIILSTESPNQSTRIAKIGITDSIPKGLQNTIEIICSNGARIILSENIATERLDWVLTKLGVCSC